MKKKWMGLLLSFVAMAQIWTCVPAQADISSDSEAVPMYRLYNQLSGEHFYTANKVERNYLTNLGWKDEGIGWYAPEDGEPVYRLYNSHGDGEHHYTRNKAEKEALVRLGWSDEGIGWYSDKNDSVPLYRQYNPNRYANNHNYTANTGEKDYLLSIGWRDEGIAWYGINQEEQNEENDNQSDGSYVDNGMPEIIDRKLEITETINSVSEFGITIGKQIPAGTIVTFIGDVPDSKQDYSNGAWIFDVAWDDENSYGALTSEQIKRYGRSVAE